MLMYQDFDILDVERGEAQGHMNFIVTLDWPEDGTGGLGATAALAAMAAAWLRAEWGIRSARVAPEAHWVRVAREDAEEANRGLAIFSRLMDVDVGFPS